jgi:hypothetical protein
MSLIRGDLSVKLEAVALKLRWSDDNNGRRRACLLMHQS